MHLTSNLKSWLGFLVLVLLLHEAHELGHHAAARLVCGCWGTRDFLLWQLCEGCAHTPNWYIASFAGPLVSALFLWLGFVWLSPKQPETKNAWGLALVFGSLPLPKLLAMAMRGGDEIRTLKQALSDAPFFPYLPVMAGALLVLLAVAAPLWRAITTIRNNYKWPVIALLLIAPMYIDRLIIEKFLNGYLIHRVGHWPVYNGASLLIWLWTALLIILLLLFRKHIGRLAIRNIR